MESDPEKQYRRAIGAFATGVAVVSAARADGALVGITVNSLTSVSLNPRLLLWCLGDQSERYDVFAAAESWGLTVLGAEDEMLARRFAVAEREGMLTAEAEMLAGAPVLRAGVAQLSCRTHQRHQAGDHLVIVGEVLDVRVKPGAALTYFRSRYGGIEDRSS
ncbi:MAG: flavin reductase family protein [Hyphomonadaceae bacterium]|nr:flavin reductase family protein [Hyphomonadaceae bacterium]